MQQVIQWNGGNWTRGDVEREISSYQQHLAMARREVEEGNERMAAYAEGYAQRLDALIQLKAKFDA